MDNITTSLSDTAIIELLYLRLETRRKKRKINQEAMAKRLGITPKSYRAIRQGKCKLETFVLLLRQLDLLENLDLLIPQDDFSPLEVFQARPQPAYATGKTAELKKAGQQNPAAMVKEPVITRARPDASLFNRKPLKTKGR